MQTTERQTAPHDLVILFSGGYDSTLLMHLAKDVGLNPIALLVDYGQVHKRELAAAVKTCRKLSIPHRQMAVSLNGVDSGLTGSGEQSRYRGVHSHHVPGATRSLSVWPCRWPSRSARPRFGMGPTTSDCLNQFSDCTQQWVYAMGKATLLAASYPIELQASLLGMRKDTIRRLGVLLGVDEADVHSGYGV